MIKLSSVQFSGVFLLFFFLSRGELAKSFLRKEQKRHGLSARGICSQWGMPGSLMLIDEQFRSCTATQCQFLVRDGG